MLHWIDFLMLNVSALAYMKELDEQKQSKPDNKISNDLSFLKVFMNFISIF